MNEIINNDNEILYIESGKTLSKGVLTIFLLILASMAPTLFILILGSFYPVIFINGWEENIESAIFVFLVLTLGITFLGWGVLLTKPLRVRKKGIDWPLFWPIPKYREYTFIPYTEIVSIYLDNEDYVNMYSQADTQQLDENLLPTKMIIRISDDYAKSLHSFNPGKVKRWGLLGDQVGMIIPHLEEAMGSEMWEKLITSEKGKM